MKLKTIKRCLGLVVTIVILLVSMPAVNVLAADNETTIYNYLKNTLGFNTAAACGVLGNISVETASSFSPTAYNSYENAWGLCQWEGSRLTNLQNRYPSSWKTLESQLGFLKWELEGGDFSGPGTVNYLRSVSDSADGASKAAKYFAQYFERCASSTYSTRMSRAQNTYWPKYSSNPDPDLILDNRYPVPFKANIISSSNVQCYSDAAMSTAAGYIYPSDDCNVVAIYTNGTLKCEVPWSDGSTKTRYVSKSAFINSSTAPSSMTAPQYGVTYLRSDAATSKGWIDPGDSITKVAVSGNMTQIIYPRGDGGLRCGWVYSSVLVIPETVNYPYPFNCRIRATEKVQCYYDVNFSSPSTPVYIYVDDDCSITAIYTNGRVQCQCPWSDGTTKTVYVESSAFFASTPSPVRMTAPKYALTYLRSTDTSASWGWIDAGDTIYKLGTSGNLTQVIYPASNSTWRCGWAYTSDITPTYTISYNANGGSGAPSNQTKTHDVGLALSSTVPTRDGYTFLGWSTSPTATTAQYAAGGAYTANSAATLYAVWKANQYNVLYDANGGIDAPSAQVKTHGVSLTLSSAKPTKVGHSFLGWSTSSTATSAQYTSGSSYTTNSAAVLYAVWKANTYTIQYNANGGTGNMASSVYSVGENKQLSKNTFTKSGHEFLGWVTDPESESVMYTDEQSVENIVVDNDNSTVILYALWQQNETHIAGDINGDDAVNNKDLTRLIKYMAGEEVTVQEASLDINGDGSINNKDLTRLMKYLAGEDVEIY